MILAELIAQVDAVKIGGRLPLTNDEMEVYQAMAFDKLTQLCYPLNLTIPYQDKDIYRYIDDIEGVEWFLKKPRIAQNDDDFIDIDSRLDLALVYFIAAMMAADDDRVILDNRAERICVEYACEVLKMGLPKAKEVYGSHSFVTAVCFDCVGQTYIIEKSFVDLVISCLLCGNISIAVLQKNQLEYYKLYLSGGSIVPVDLDYLRALDAAIFLRLINESDDYSMYSSEELSAITTLPCEFEKMMNGDFVEAWVKEIETRLSLGLRG